jgi:exoribonuclease-2
MKAMREVEHVALGTNSSSSIMRDLNMSATPEKAHALLLKTGVWTDKNDPWPQRNNIDMTIPELPVPDLPEEARRDLTHLPAYAIDDPNNQDPDDALSFDFETGIFWVHVADVAALAPSGSELDNEARARGANLYIPEQVVPMLPDDITKKLGLGLQEISPALSFALKVSESGEPELLEVVPTLIKVDRITYGDADERLDEKLFAEMRSITSRFQQRRFENGAVIIDMPEVKIKIAEDDSINFMPINTSPGRELVTNAMLMCGEAVGKFAYANHLPIPYTVQEMADEELAPGESLAGMFARRKQMRPSMQSLTPGRHAGLGMDIYSRVTSPLRRYSDLLVHQQIRAFVLGQQIMDADTVDARIAESERSAGQTRSTERTVNEFWTLVYLLRRPDWEGTAVVIDKTDHKSTIVIPELAYITKMRLHKEIELNDELDLRLINVNLPEMSAHFKYSSQK